MWLRDASTQDSSSGSLDGFPFTANSTTTIANEVAFAAAQSERTSIVALASFNAMAGAALAVGIFWDGYASGRKRAPGSRLRALFFQIIGPAEIFPFSLSIAIAVQGIVFAVAQSKGLDELMILGCTPVSRVMLPALFAIPFLHIVYGVDTTVRTFWRQRFPSRRSWSTPACLGVVSFGLLMTVMVTEISQPAELCFASLFWFVQRWRLGCFVALTLIVILVFLMAGAVFFQLRRLLDIDPNERMAASWMVYFLVLGGFQGIFLLPFFYDIIFTGTTPLTEGSPHPSLIAAVAANLSGLITAALYCFLRLSPYSTIAPAGYREYDRQKLTRGIRIWAPANFAYKNQMAQPVSPPPLYRGRGVSRHDEKGIEEERIESPLSTPRRREPNPLRLNAVAAADAELSKPKPVLSLMPRTNSPGPLGGGTSTPNAQRPVLFRARTDIPLQNALRAESPLPDLPLPPDVVSPGGIRHRRDSSLASSATVQIGFRVSNVANMPSDDSGRPSLDSVIALPSQDAPLNTAEARKNSPLAVNTTAAVQSSVTAALLDKPLPKLRRTMPEEKELLEKEEDLVKLSPTVYSPKSQDSGTEGAAPEAQQAAEPKPVPWVANKLKIGIKRPSWI